MGNPFTPTFLGSPVNPAQVSFSSMTLPTSTTLTWPLQLMDSSGTVPFFANVSVSSGVTITMPNALYGSEGNATIWNNIGANSLSIVNVSGGAITTISAGTAQYVILNDNTTSAGSWNAIALGLGTVQAVASQLAGPGLGAAAGLLRVQLPVTILNADYTVTSNDRDIVFEWAAGSGTVTMPSAVSAGNNFITGFNNQGSGTLTLAAAAGQTIDGSASITLGADVSCLLISDGANWISIGRGQSATFTITYLSKSVAGSGGVTLASSEAAAMVQDFTGVITANQTVDYGTNAFVYSIFNNTTGSFSLTLRATSGDSGVAVSQGSYAVVRNTGAAMRNAATAGVGTVTQINTGSGLTGGPITSSGTIDLATVSGIAGTYQPASINVNTYGQVTSVSNTAIITVARTFSGASVRGTFSTVPTSTLAVIDFSTANNFMLTLTGHSTISALFTSAQIGQGGMIMINQNASGGWVPTFTGNVWQTNTSVSLSSLFNTAALAKNAMPYFIDTTTSILMNVQPGWTTAS